MAKGGAWQSGEGVMHGKGGHAWQGACVAGGHAWWGCAWQGACMVGGCAWQGGHAWQGGMHGRGCVWWGGSCVAGETATEADGTHPTGMHSCFK